MKELFNILEARYSVSEIIEILNDFDEDALRDYAIEHDVCVKCGCGLTIHRWKESRGEHFGFPAYEPLSELKCENCGETY